MGVQALFWIVSGLYMTAIHIDIIHGDHLIRTPDARPIATDGLVEPSAILQGADRASSLRLVQQLDQPLYILTDASGQAL